MKARLIKITRPNIWYKDLSLGTEFTVNEELPRTYRTIWNKETVDFLKVDCELI